MIVKPSPRFLLKYTFHIVMLQPWKKRSKHFQLPGLYDEGNRIFEMDIEILRIQVTFDLDEIKNDY